MKKIKLFILSFAFIALGMLVSCNSNETNENDSSEIIEDTVNTGNDTKETTEVEDVKAEDQTVKYVCPAGCEEGKSDKAGNCPTCGMELIENVD